MDFDSREDVIIWICANQNVRRNITPEQKAYLLGKRYEAEKRKEGRPGKLPHDGGVIPGETARRIAAEVGAGKNTVERAGQYARAVDTLATDSPTIKRKILSGEINQPRTAIVEIAAKPAAERAKAVERLERGEPPEPEVKTNVCRSCGRDLPLDSFVKRGPGRPPIYCRQCNAMAKATTGRMSDVRIGVREHMQTIEETVDTLYGNKGGAEYTIDDVLNKIRLGGEQFAKLVRIIYEQHPALIVNAKNVEAVNALLEDITGTIYTLRRG
jgi:hypothetical protein